MLNIYDKAKWHIEAGEEESAVLERFQLIMDFLRKKHMLTAEGEEEFQLGVDENAVLHSRMVNEEGAAYLEKNIDRLISMNPDDITKELQAI